MSRCDIATDADSSGVVKCRRKPVYYVNAGTRELHVCLEHAHELIGEGARCDAAEEIGEIVAMLDRLSAKEESGQ